MSIRYRCEECGAVMKIRDSLAGTRGKCPTCRAKFTVPLQSTLTEEEFAAEQANSSLSNGSSLELASESPSSPSLQPAPPSSPKLPPAPPAKAPPSSPKLDTPTSPKASQSSSKLTPVTPPAKASASSTKLPPVTPPEPPVAETASEPAAEVPAEEPPADDFDAAAFLMSDDDPNAKKSAGLAKQAPGGGETKPAVDKLGRRYFGAAPKAAAAEAPPEDEAGASVTTTAKLPVEPVREKIDWKATRKRLIRLSPWMVAAGVVAGITYWGSAGYFLPRLPLPRLAHITGVVQLDGAGFPGMIVHLTPVNATQGLSTSGQTIRLTDPVGATNENGEYEISYLGQPGAPLGKVRIWLEPVHPVDYKKIPSKYQQPGPDIREVREAGNENKFQLDLKEAK